MTRPLAFARRPFSDQVEPDNMKDPFNLCYAAHHVSRVWSMPEGTRLGFNWTDPAMTIEGVSVPKHAARVLP